MSIRTVPYFSFPGTARQAMEFYHSIFGGELTAHTFGEFGAVVDDDPARDGIMHTAITGGLIDLAASDYDERFCDGNPLVNGNHVQISLWGDDHDEGRRLFERLAEGGAVEMPFEPQVWGDTYGGCIDRYGQSWSVNVAGTADE